VSAAFSGIVLAGGQSKRLGVDKALLVFGGRTLLEIAVERLKELTPDVVVACGAGTRPGWPVVASRNIVDRVPGRGPLAGLDAGLRIIANEAAVVVACDMPFLDSALLRHLGGRLGNHLAAVPMIGGRYQALHAVYSRRCLPRVEELLLQGGSMMDLLAVIDTEVVAEDEVRSIDASGLSSFNLNSQDDLDQARDIWERRQATR
jgi:molybdopterin-guanine dinucleotide biosynthesis protein A